MKSAKTRKLIDVRGFLRGTDPVKSFKRLQLVNAEEGGALKAKTYDDLIKELDDVKGNFESYYGSRPDDKHQKEQQDGILKAYGGEHGGIFDPIFNSGKEETPLKDIYDKAGGYMPQPYSFDAIEVVDILTTNHKSLQHRVEQSEKVERIIGQMTKSETERIDPFTFRIKSSLDEVPPLINDIYNRINSKPLKQEKSIRDRYFDEFNKTVGENPDYMSEHSARRVSQVLDSLIRGSDLNEKTISSKIMPSVIATQIFDPNARNEELLGNTKINHNLISAIKETLPEEFKNQDVLLGDPENIRFQLKKALMNYINTDTYKQVRGNENQTLANALMGTMKEDQGLLLNKLKSLKASDVPIFHTYLMEHSRIFGGLDKPDLMKNIQNFSNATTKIGFNIFNNKKNDYIHFSNNPIEVLTMSPDGYISSCQSISSDGYEGVDNYNINVASSLYGTNDFVIFRKQYDNNIKSERLSVTFNEHSKNFKSQEDKRVYSQPLEGEHLKKSLQKNGVQDKISSYNGGNVHLDVLDNLEQGQEQINIIGEYKENLTKSKEFVDNMHDEFNKNVDNMDDQDELKTRFEDDQEQDHADNYNEYEKRQRNYTEDGVLLEFDNALREAITDEDISQSFLYGSPMDSYRNEIDSDNLRSVVSDKENSYSDEFENLKSAHSSMSDDFRYTLEELNEKAKKLK